MVLRRPNLVRWTNYMKESIEVLESHPDAYPSDKLFCQHVKIQHICEDIGLQFLMDDNTATISITDPKVTYALTVLENQLKTWKENIPPQCRGPGLQFFEHVTSLYLHEIALHFNHNIEDFRLPFTEESLRSVNNTTETLTPNQMAALEACVKAAHGILDTMLTYDADLIKSLPMLLFFVRCVYALVILIKMHVAVCTPNSEVGKIIKEQDLRVDYYVEGLLLLFGKVAKEGDVSRPHPKILIILSILRGWFAKHQENIASGHRPKPPTQATHEQETQRHVRSNQTPLHLLSQLATGDPQIQQQPIGKTQTTDWTFDSPTVMNYSKAPPSRHPDSKMPVHQQQPPPPPPSSSSAQNYASLSGTTIYPITAPGPDVQQSNMVDPANQAQTDYGWGSGFEQAMDIALGGVDSLQGDGLDGWFLGDNMAPFAFNGEIAFPPGGSGSGLGW
nr:hypothetical protein CFP56_70438 [Quercus suber]